MKLNVKQLNLRIERRNKAFAKLKPAAKRVAVAVDVLEQLRLKKINAKNGTYLESPALLKRAAKRNEDLQLSDMLAKVKSCDVCAIGAAFVCSVKTLDQVKLKELVDFEDVKSNRAYAERWGEDPEQIRFIDDDVMRDYLVASGAFTRKQLHVIEAVFERNEGYRSFNRDAENDEERLRRTWEFIRDHKGSVNFPKDPGSEYVSF